MQITVCEQNTNEYTFPVSFAVSATHSWLTLIAVIEAAICTLPRYTFQLGIFFPFQFHFLDRFIVVSYRYHVLYLSGLCTRCNNGTYLKKQGSVLALIRPSVTGAVVSVQVARSNLWFLGQVVLSALSSQHPCPAVTGLHTKSKQSNGRGGIA